MVFGYVQPNRLQFFLPPGSRYRKRQGICKELAMEPSGRQRILRRRNMWYRRGQCMPTSPHRKRSGRQECRNRTCGGKICHPLGKRGRSCPHHRRIRRPPCVRLRQQQRIWRERQGRMWCMDYRKLLGRRMG